MARSGDFGTSNQYIKYYIEAIQNWQDVAGNFSNVTVRVWVYRTNNYTTWGNGTVSVTINGGSYSASITTSQKITTTPIVVFERNLNIGHNADGTGYVDISAMISHNSPFSSGWNGWRMGLTTIPRASQPSLSKANVPMGTTITIYMNRKSTAFTHTVKYVFGNQSGTIATGVTDQVNWTVPMSLANAIPDATAGWGSIVVETYNGGNYVGSNAVRFDASVPDNIKPSLSGVSHSETVPSVSSLIGSYVQGLSKIKITINGASGVYGSSIRSYTIRWENASSNSSSATFDVNNSGNHDIVAEVVDSRGRKTTKTITGINVLAYSPPRITEFKADRANSNGTLNQLGTYAKVTRTASVSSLKVGTAEKNTLTYTIKAKPKSSSTWTTKVSATTLATGVTTLTGSNTIGTFDATQSYDLRIEVSDKFNTVISIGTISTGQVTMSWGKNGVGIGKIWEQGTLDVAGDAYVNGLNLQTANLLPAGDDNTLAYWQNLKAGNYFVTPNTLTSQPEDYGFLILNKYGSDFNALFFKQPYGAVYRRAGRSSEMDNQWLQITSKYYTAPNTMVWQFGEIMIQKKEIVWTGSFFQWGTGYAVDIECGTWAVPFANQPQIWYSTESPTGVSVLTGKRGVNPSSNTVVGDITLFRPSSGSGTFYIKVYGIGIWR